MSDKITRNVSGSSSSDSEASSSPDDGVGGRDRSSLGAVEQNSGGVRSGESGGAGRSSRDSLMSPGRAESQELGARPRKKTEGKGGKGGRGTGKGIEWNKKDRRGAKLYRGRGQELAAERAAKAAAEEVARAAKAAAEGRGGDKEDDGLGLIVLRAEGPRTHDHGHRSHRRTKPERAGIDPNMGRFGNLFGGLFVVALLGAPIAALVCLLGMASDAPETQGDAPPTTGPVLRSGYYRAVAMAVVYLILLTCVIALACSASGSSSKNKKRKK